MTKTLSSSTLIDHAVSRFHAARVIVALLAREARERRAGANPIRTAIIFSACLSVVTRQIVVVCPGILVCTIAILTLVTGVYSAIRVALVVDFALPQVTF